MTKSGFIGRLMGMDKDDIEEFIRQNGKPPKMIIPITLHPIDKQNNSNSKKENK